MIDFIMACFMIMIGNWQVALIWVLCVGLGLIEPEYYGYSLVFLVIANIINKIYGLSKG